MSLNRLARTARSPSSIRWALVLALILSLYAPDAAALSALPEGAGLSAAFPDDAGIAGHPDVVFTEDFEGYSGDHITWADMGEWDNVYGDLVVTRAAANVHGGSQALQVTHVTPQGHGAAKELAGSDTLFVRYYMKFHAQFPGCHHTGFVLRGRMPGTVFVNTVGTKPTGVDHYLANFDHLSPLHGWQPAEDDVPPGWGYNYCYHMDQSSEYGDILLPAGTLNGTYPFGDDFTPRPNVFSQRDRWTCYELMLQSNTVGVRDGRVGLWIDGVLVADHTNLRFRTIEELKVRIVNLNTYSSKTNDNKILWYDDVVVATNYIGPKSTEALDTTPPTVSLVAPAAGATVSGTSVTVSASASDNVGVAGVQFTIDGANLGAEDVSAPYSISWDTTTASDGVHTLRAVARDAAGNESTSAAVTLTVSNSTVSDDGVAIFTTETPVQEHNTDGSGVNYELGTRFTSAVDGEIMGIRFWKDSLESGAHTGNIWSPSGALLASVAFTGESASGWQEQSLAAPLPISTSTVYTVSVNTAGAYFAATEYGLASAVVNGPLSTLVGDNGVFGPVGTYPVSSWNDTNYFRDVAFVAGPGDGDGGGDVGLDGVSSTPSDGDDGVSCAQHGAPRGGMPRAFIVWVIAAGCAALVFRGRTVASRSECRYR